MSKGGDLWYECRFCGKRYMGGHAPDASLAVVFGVTDSTPKSWGIPVKMLNVHRCDFGGIGVADFIGAIEDQ